MITDHQYYFPLVFGLLLFLLTIPSTVSAQRSSDSLHAASDAWEDEIFYQIFPRSFYDSNRDSIGDLRGIMDNLDYLQDLGVTAIWTTPILKSRAYHNYYADSFDSLDPAYGTWQDWTALVKEIHYRGMKVFIDMEPQYVADLHPWYLDSHNNPASPFSSYIWYSDSTNGKAITRGLGAYNRSGVEIVNIRMNNSAVRQAITRLFRKFADPNNDGVFDDGVDGFRIDHLMDDLDHKGLNVHLYAGFWKPLFDEIRKVNPKIFFLGEQADWGFGKADLTVADCDGVFAFPQWWGTTTFQKKRLLGLIDTTWMSTPPGKHQFTFIENHDVDRYASQVNGDSGKLRIGAALNILLKGVPCLYYGQEIGMRGRKGRWMNDGNDIPIREAMRWHRTVAGKGMALWYANSGPWWDQSNLHDSDGISVEEQHADPGSLWNFYQKLIQLRKSLPALRRGSYAVVPNDNDSVISFIRTYRENKAVNSVVVIMNLGRDKRNTKLNIAAVEPSIRKLVSVDRISDLPVRKFVGYLRSAYPVDLDGYQVVVLATEM